MFKQANCPRCKCEKFEYVEISASVRLDPAVKRYGAVQCVACGAVLGIAESLAVRGDLDAIMRNLGIRRNL